MSTHAIINAPETAIILTIEAKGEIISSNFADFAESVRAHLATINRDLQTDEEFDQADSDAKRIAAAEADLKAAKDKALADAEQLHALFSQIDDLGSDMAKARLDLTKQIAKRKEEIKAELQAEYFGKIKCAAHVRRKVYFTIIQDAIKGKRTVETMRKALEIAVTVANSNIDLCRSKLDEHAAQHGAQSLPDRDDLETMAPAFLEAELRRRVDAVKAQEEAARLRKEAAEAQAAAAKAKLDLAEANKPPLPPAASPVVSPVASQPSPQFHASAISNEATDDCNAEWIRFSHLMLAAFAPVKAARAELRHPENIAKAQEFALVIGSAWKAANTKEVKHEAMA